MNYELLNQVIDDSGMKRSFIAKALGLSPKIFHDRTAGLSEWKVREVVAFCNLMNLKKKVREEIFFT